MCWVSNKKPVKKIADKDITVYKLFRKTGEALYSPVFYYIWLRGIGKRMPENAINPIYETYSKEYVINEGFHSLTHKVYCEKRQYDDNSWIDEITNRVILSDHRHLHLYECTIPEGSIYYINGNGDVVSNRLIVKKEVDVEYKIIK